MLHFGVEGDAVLFPDCADNPVFQADDFVRGGMAAGVHDYQRLVLVHLGAAEALALEAALLYHPRGGHFYHVANHIVGHFVFGTVILAGGFHDAVKVLTCDYRIAEETAGAPDFFGISRQTLFPANHQGR